MVSITNTSMNYSCFPVPYSSTINAFLLIFITFHQDRHITSKKHYISIETNIKVPIKTLNSIQFVFYRFFYCLNTMFTYTFK